jgi:hypothetical protein
MNSASPLRNLRAPAHSTRRHPAAGSRSCQQRGTRSRCLPASPKALLTAAALAIAALLMAGGTARSLTAQSLQGSHESMARQNEVAQQHDYAYLRTTQDVVRAVDTGTLVEVRGNGDFELAIEEVSFPYARPEVKTFLEQLGHAYRAACGEPLVVTSLVRPITRQPWNASPISVHPTGMAVDLRHSDRRGCRQYLESTLLALEAEGMVEATRERWPAHYHVAVFPDPLLLPGPIGDPNGVTRLAALHRQSGGADLRTENDEAASDGRVHLVRSARTGRLRITQGRERTAIARRSGRVAVHRASAASGSGRRRTAAHPPAARTAKHRAHRSHGAAGGPATFTAR